MLAKRWSILLIPHQQGKILELKTSSRIIFTLVILFVLWFVITVGSIVRTASGYVRESTRKRAIELSRVENQLEKAQMQMKLSLKEADGLIKDLVGEKGKLQEELVNLQKRYEFLKTLVEGQEEIAEIHRKILKEETFWQKFYRTSFNLTLGIVASIVAAIALARLWRKSVEIDKEEALAKIEKLNKDSKTSAQQADAD